MNVRRQFVFVGRSIDAGTRWAAFEPNDGEVYAYAMAARGTLGDRDRRVVRAALVAELERVDAQIAALTRRFDDIVEAAELTSTDDEHDPEGATIGFERSQASALLRHAHVDRAAAVDGLGRVGSDAFGVCEACAEPIGVERLVALPSTRRCVVCAG